MPTSDFFLRRFTVYSRAPTYCDCRRSPIQTAYIVKKLNGLAKTRFFVIGDKKSIQHTVDVEVNFLGNYEVYFEEDRILESSD